MTTRTLGSPRYLAGALVVLAGAFSMIGCDEAYSSFVIYPLRTDPLVLSDKLGDEQSNPDRPGIFPIMSPKDILNPVNPMFAKREKLFPEGILRDPTLVSSPDKKLIKETLDAWFGTPANPTVKDAPSVLELNDKALAEGSSLYRVHCLHCHGVPGDGRGVTARWINPHPRDFRQGLFKFQSVDQSSGPLPPRREDLRRTIQQGVEGTAMPAFNLLDDKKIDALVSYVIHLSIRGQLEYDTIKNGFDFDAAENKLIFDADANGTIPEYMKTVYDPNLKRWEKSQTKAIKVRAYPFPEGVDTPEFKASVQRGYYYFTGNEDKQKGAKGLNCVSCHVNFGRQAMFKWDSWGTLVRPNNITNGVYRGGRKATDIYYRVHSGINGSNMPAFGATESTAPTAVWDLVNFVQTVPYPAMREKLGIVLD